MIPFNKQQGWYVLEIGGGSMPHPQSDVRVDKEFIQGMTSFTVDFAKEEWLEIGSSAFDIVLCQTFSHLVNDATAPAFLKQVLRVLKPEGKLLFAAVNRDAAPQEKVAIQLSPSTAVGLFAKAGFIGILISPLDQYGMCIEAKKPVTPTVESSPEPPPVPTIVEPRKSARDIYNREYWDNYRFSGFAWDYPENIGIAHKILDKQPQSVVEIGAGRGYILKRIQDAGIPAQGIDVSSHAWLTRVCDPINVHDLLEIPWPLGTKECDLCYSVNLLEHIPEDALENFTSELNRISKRGLHAVITNEQHPPTRDDTRCTLRDLSYWRKILPEGHEVVDIREMTSGTMPEEVLKGDGKLKLNLGCAFTQYFYNWTNIDVIDADSFARIFGYKYVRHDIKNGLQYSTGVVDRIQLHHVLEHFSYAEGLQLLRECRRVIRPDGCMRLAVPNTRFLAGCYVNDHHELDAMNQMSASCATAPTYVGKLWAVLCEGHRAFHDEETLQNLLEESGWDYHPATFRQTEVPAVQDILRETLEMSYNGSSLFCDATPS